MLFLTEDFITFLCLGFVPSGHKTPIYQIFYERDCNLGSEILEIVGLWAPEELKIQQLVLLGA